MEFISQTIPHYSTRKGCVVHKFSNDNGVEITSTPHQAAILSICTPDSSGALQPLLPNHQQKPGSYLNTSVTFGGVLGPISFPYHETEVLLGKKTHFLPTTEDKKQFRLMRWEAAVHCSGQGCKVTYRSMSSGNRIPPSATAPTVGTATHPSSSVHTVEIELDQQNRLFTRYSSRSATREPFSLGHNLIWNLSSGSKGVFRQQMAINANQFAATPFVSKLLSVDQSDQDYRKQKAVRKRCAGYYRLQKENITETQCAFEMPVEKLTPAVMLLDSHTNRYLQIQTNYPCLRVALHHNRQKSGYTISLTPCVLLDMPELFARKSRHIFRCCYQFGIIN